MQESFKSKFIRTVVHAEFKSNDTVPILSTPFIHIFGSDIKTIKKMSPTARFLEHAWLTFAGLISGAVLLIGLIILIRPDGRADMTVAGMIFFGLIWLFCVVQFLSLIGYFRWRLKQ